MTDVKEHPEAALFEAYVLGALDEPERRGFVEHVSTCAACAGKLEDEARVELAMFAVHEGAKGAHSATKPRPRVVSPLRSPKRRTAVVAFGVLAAAAALFFFVRSRNVQPTTNGSPMTMTVSAPRETKPIPPVTCPDAAEQEKCVEEAHRHGLFVAYPPWAAAPRFGVGASGRGPNGPPFGDGQI